MSRSNVTVMRKERRRDRRRSMQAEALLDGRPVQLTDLSAAGFGVALDATDRQPHDFRVGQRLRLEVPVPQGEPLSLPVEIVRPSGENGVVGGIFLDISDAAYNTIEALRDGRPVHLTDLGAAGVVGALDATVRTPHDFRVGQRLRLEVPVPQGEPLSLPVEIVRPSGENGVVGGIFLDISDAAYNTIEALLTGRFRRRR